MINTITSSPLFGISLCLVTFYFGDLIYKKLKIPVLNALVLSSAMCIAVLLLFNIPYDNFNSGAQFLSLMIIPTTAVLAINIFEQRLVLKQYFWPVLLGCATGAITSVVSVYVICRLFVLNSEIIASLLPKSTTTAIAMELAQGKGGIAAIAAVTVLLTGVFGTILAPYLCKIFKIRNPVAQGIAIGTSSHAFGITKAVKMGEVQGSMSGIALSVTGLITSFILLFVPV